VPAPAHVPEQLVVDFDVHDPALALTPTAWQERVAELRDMAPLVYSQSNKGYWVVTHYDLVCEVLRDPTTYSSFPNDLANVSQGRLMPIELDPPEHTVMRKVLLPLFTPKRMQEIEPRIRATINDLIDQFCEKGECEFVDAFAHALPTRVFLELMGWPLDDADMFSETTDIALQGLPGRTAEESQQAQAEAAFKIYGYFADVIERVKRGDYDMSSLTAQIILAPIEEPDGTTRELTVVELGQMFFLLALAGLHTTQGSLAWSIINLSANPEQRADLIANPDDLPAAIEEILRYEATASLGRRATCATTLGGMDIAEGDQLLVLLSSANRDADHFGQPDDLQIDRSPNHHVSFGMGVHRCLGSHLARMELRLALEELHKRIPDYQPVEGDPPRMTGTQIRSCSYLPIQFTPSPRLG
jgi:cytochrome P450